MCIKKRAILTVLFILLAGVSIFAQQTAVPGTPAMVTIKGTVPQILKLELSFPAEVILDLENESFKELGTANLVSNLLGSYTVSVSSQNSGKLVGADAGNTDEVAYDFTFGGTTVDLADGPFTLPSSGKTSKAGVPYVVSVSYTSMNDLPDYLSADEYSDTLTFTISAN